MVQWVTGMGAHFKNGRIHMLRRRLGAQHHYTTAYTPQATCSVEVVNHELLKGAKTLLSERTLPTRD